MTKNEVMQMALTALENVNCDSIYEQSCSVCNVIEALRTALAQPEKEWVGLTDEEINDHWTTAMRNTKGTRLPIPEFARAIEAKLKEKNT